MTVGVSRWVLIAGVALPAVAPRARRLALTSTALDPHLARAASEIVSVAPIEELS